ncbi:hypothetical protein AN454_29815 [Pseudomonas aeruginosa]|nr:hypothetical protein AN454_29815 [Pseudomonas aeruginosa]
MSSIELFVYTMKAGMVVASYFLVFLVVNGLMEAWPRLESRTLELRVRRALLASFMTVPTVLWALYFFTDLI